MAKLFKGLKNLPYSKRLTRLNQPSLIRQRVREDLIKAFKYNKGHTNKELVVREQVRTSSNGFKQYKFRFNKGTDKNCCISKIADKRNRLARRVVSADTTDASKMLDKFIDGEDRW